MLRGDTEINLLDQASKLLDIAYSRTKGLNERHKADKISEKFASDRLKTWDSSIGKNFRFGGKGYHESEEKTGNGDEKNIENGKPLRNKAVLWINVERDEKGNVSPPKKRCFLPFLIPLLGSL